MQFGQGSKQRRIQAGGDRSHGAIAEEIAQDKELTRMLLAAVGVPVPEGRPVADAEDAWAAAEEIGVPVVVKPRDGNQGPRRGHQSDHPGTGDRRLSGRRSRKARASRSSSSGFATGHDYRLLVVAGRVVAAARREPAQVLGDGTHTIRELIDLVNADPRRGERSCHRTEQDQAG